MCGMWKKSFKSILTYYKHTLKIDICFHLFRKLSWDKICICSETAMHLIPLAFALLEFNPLHLIQSKSTARKREMISFARVLCCCLQNYQKEILGQMYFKHAYLVKLTFGGIWMVFLWSTKNENNNNKKTWAKL